MVQTRSNYVLCVYVRRTPMGLDQYTQLCEFFVLFLTLNMSVVFFHLKLTLTSEDDITIFNFLDK